MRELEGRAEALAGTFNTQDVANTLWAYATMGREPKAGLMRELEGRAEAVAGTFKAQGVANTLWETQQQVSETLHLHHCSQLALQILLPLVCPLAPVPLPVGHTTAHVTTAHVDGIPRPLAAILVLHRQPVV